MTGGPPLVLRAVGARLFAASRCRFQLHVRARGGCSIRISCRVLTRSGPDGQETTYTYDDLGRTQTVSRNGMSVIYYYDAAGRITDVDYGNGTSEQRSYADGNRLLWIKHKNGLGVAKGDRHRVEALSILRAWLGVEPVPFCNGEPG